MSNFNGHFTGGLIASCIGTSIAVIGNQHMHWMLSIEDCAFIWSSTLFFSLFPDIDIKSKPSKIFYTAFFIGLCYLYLTKRFETATILSMLAITPQMTKHRGFFHYKITALLIPAYTFILYGQHYMTLHTAVAMYFAGVVGYFTHLLLDNEF